MTLREQIKRDEGTRLENGKHRAYQDSEGVWTIGFGTNLQTLVIDEELAERFLDVAIEWATEAARRIVPEFSSLSEPRRAVLVNMVYNMGPLRFTKFQRMRNALHAGDHEGVAHEMLDSKWHEQVGERAERLARQWLTEEWQ